MSRSRHHHKGHKAEGGRINMKVSGNPDVFKEAEERKHGGRTKHVKMEGKKAKHHMGRPGRKRGGRVGADMSPLSSAHRSTATGERAGGKPD